MDEIYAGGAFIKKQKNPRDVSPVKLHKNIVSQENTAPWPIDGDDHMK